MKQVSDEYLLREPRWLCWCSPEAQGVASLAQASGPGATAAAGRAALNRGQWWACLEADQRPPRLCSPRKFVLHDYVDQDGEAEGLARPSGAPGPAITAASCVFQASEMKPEMRRLLFPRRGGGGGGGRDVKRLAAMLRLRLVHSCSIDAALNDTAKLWGSFHSTEFPLSVTSTISRE